MQYNVRLRGQENETVLYDPMEVFVFLEKVGDEYNFEDQLWAEECMSGDVYEDDYCIIVSLLDDRFC